MSARHRRQPRIAAKRDAAESEIVQALRQAACAVYHLDHPVDLLVGRAGRNYLLEVKSPDQPKSKRKLTEAQVEFQNEWHQRGQVARVETVDEALRAVGLIR